MREHFKFYNSFVDAGQKLQGEDRASFYEAIIIYSMRDEVINMTPLADIVFTAIKPVLDSQKGNYENGKKGGRPKKETPLFKNKKPPFLKKENLEGEGEGERDIKKGTFNIGVFSPEEFKKLSSYRSKIGDSFKTQQAVTGISNKFQECYKLGYSFDVLLELMAEKQWKTIKPEWVKKELSSSPANNSSYVMIGKKRKHLDDLTQSDMEWLSAMGGIQCHLCS